MRSLREAGRVIPRRRRMGGPGRGPVHLRGRAPVPPVDAGRRGRHRRPRLETAGRTCSSSRWRIGSAPVGRVARSVLGDGYTGEHGPCPPDRSRRLRRRCSRRWLAGRGQLDRAESSTVALVNGTTIASCQTWLERRAHGLRQPPRPGSARIRTPSPAALSASHGQSHGQAGSVLRWPGSIVGKHRPRLVPRRVRGGGGSWRAPALALAG